MEKENNWKVDDVVLGGAKKGRLGRITDRALNTVAVIDQGVPADRALARTIKTARDLGSRERRFLKDVIYALMRHRRRIQYRLQKGLKACGKKIALFDEPIILRMELLCALLEQGHELPTLSEWDSYAFKRVPKLFERIQKSNLKIKDYSVQWSLPAWMGNRLSAAQGDVLSAAWAEASVGRAPLTLRVNSSTHDRDKMLAHIRAHHDVECVATVRAPNGITILGRADVESWPEHKNGSLEIQDEGSQLIIEALAARPGENVLDACAGAGGKTLGIVAAMKGQGNLVAIDHEKKKLAELVKRAKRAEFKNIKTVTCDLIDLPKKYIAWADRVLVDAPCSGTGRLRRQPDAKWRLTEAKMLQYPARQFALLTRGVDAAKPGGLIIYATCSLFAEENEVIVERLLSEDPRVEPLSLSQLSPAFSEQAWTYIEPGDHLGPDGFFLAAFRKRST